MVSLVSGKNVLSKIVSIVLATAITFQPLTGHDLLFGEEEGSPIEGPQAKPKLPNLPEEPTVGGGSSTAAGVLPANPPIVPDTSNTSDAGIICYTKDGKRIPSGEGEKDPGKIVDLPSRIIIRESETGGVQSPRPNLRTEREALDKQMEAIDQQLPRLSREPARLLRRHRERLEGQKRQLEQQLQRQEDLPAAEETRQHEPPSSPPLLDSTLQLPRDIGST